MKRQILLPLLSSMRIIADAHTPFWKMPITPIIIYTFYACPLPVTSPFLSELFAFSVCFIYDARIPRRLSHWLHSLAILSAPPRMANSGHDFREHVSMVRTTPRQCSRYCFLATSTSRHHHFNRQCRLPDADITMLSTQGVQHTITLLYLAGLPVPPLFMILLC